MKKWLAWVGFSLLFALALSLGYWVGGRRAGSGEAPHEHGSVDGGGTQSPAVSEVWTCSMHPQIKQPNPGKCPLCGMDLIPLDTGGEEDEGARELTLSAAARSLAGVEVAPVERRIATRDVRMVGKVEYDETRLATITAWVSGRLDRLYVDYTGVPVQKGDHLVYMYSPEVLTAQQELLQAIRAVRELANSQVEIVRATARSTVEAARGKLALWGLTEQQIAAVEERGKPSDHITIYAPIGGVVVHKNAVEGMYVQTGSPIYTIADLNHVWVKLDAYESDLAWLRYAQEVVFEAEAYPGETFVGRIAFIQPVLNDTTRTVKVRVNVPNEDGRLKPGMFVRARVRSSLGGEGRVVEPDLAGKWISPMHPEIVKDAAGACDVCGMPLVRAETLGFVSADEGDLPPPLVIPASAPLITGKRAVVYVQSPDDPSHFEGKSVTLGLRAGDYYIVEDGLSEGELVVVKGNFKIDSALQILAKTSMMSAERDTVAAAPDPESASPVPASTRHDNVPKAFSKQLGTVFHAYLGVQGALSTDDFAKGKSAAKEVARRLATVDMMLLTGAAHTDWMKSLETLRKSADAIAGTDDIQVARENFALLSEALLSATKAFGAGLGQSVFAMTCPMAFDNRGATWLQAHDKVENPYFGAAMFRCGEVSETIQSALAEEARKDGRHE